MGRGEKKKDFHNSFPPCYIPHHQKRVKQTGQRQWIRPLPSSDILPTPHSPTLHTSSMATTSKSLTVATTGPISPASASASASGSGASTPTSSAASSIHHDAAHAADKNSSNSGSNSHPLTDILVLYQKATSNFLLRQLASAYSTSLEALELLTKTNRNYGLDQAESVSTRRSYFILKQKLWILNITIFGAMLADRAEDEQNQHGQGRGLFRRRFRGSSKESPEKLVEDLWRRLVEDYCGVEGDVDGQVMVAL